MGALLWLAALALPLAASQAIQDSRCYLMNGGAVESFFISEDTPVGSVIGTLSVNGDPRAEGDISLSLQEKNAPVSIAPGSKNLTLLRPLDREERAGPASVYVNVRCDRRHTADPSFVIPVSVRVWDVNDNAPAWRGAPYRVRLSELLATGARVLATSAADPDQPGPHATVHYTVLPGTGANHLAFANELDGTLLVATPLDYETLRNFTVRLRAQDQGSPPLHSDTTLEVEVLDADDQNPKFSHDHYSAVLPENATDGTILETSPGPISAMDQDTGINAPLHYSAAGDAASLVRVDRDSGSVAATARLLETDLPLTVVIKASQVDNPDRYALATLAVSQAAGGAGGAGRAGAAGGAGGVRFARRGYAAAVPEDAPPGTVLATLHVEPHGLKSATPLQFYVSERSFLEKFAINGAGELLLRRPLDYETTDTYRYQVMVTDGVANDTATINISVQNVNEWEPRFRYPQYEFRLDGDAGPGGPGGLGGPGTPGLLVGKLDVFDGDKPDTVSLTLHGPDAGLFYVNASGEVFLRPEALARINSSALHLVATARDSGSPPRQTSVPVVVRVSERLVAGGRARGAAVLPAFAAALALLALLVLALLCYIVRGRRRQTKSSTPADAAPAGEKGAGGAGAAGGSGSLLSVSAGASTILDSNSSLDLRNDPHRSESGGRLSQRVSRTKIGPAPAANGTSLNAALISELTQRAAGGGAGGAGGAGSGSMSDHLAARAGRSGVAWPSSTIPARVKKLSWDDAAHADGSERREEAAGAAGAGGPGGASAAAEHMNLTVYF